MRESLFVVAAMAVILSACATTTPESPLVAIKASPDDIRLQEFFEKKKDVEYQGDKLTLVARLEIPEVEQPRYDELKIQHKLKDAKFPGLHFFNGNVCIRFIGQSAQKKDYVKKKWITEVVIDGKRVKHEAEIAEGKIYDLGQNKVNMIPGEFRISACTVDKFPKVSKVQFNLKDAPKTTLVSYDWSAPWPPIHVAPPVPPAAEPAPANP